ncbi:MAG: transglutaminase domain-containing protein, partial [Syntrophales bacterium]
YRGVYYSDVGGYYVVPQKNAHVWVEAYFNGIGWVRYDPTPAGTDFFTQSWQRGILFRIRLVFDILQYYWNSSVINFDLQKQFFIVLKIESVFRKPFRMTWPEIKIPFAKIGYALCGSVLLGILLLWFIRRTSPEKRIVKLFLKKMARRGYIRKPSEGLEEFVGRMRDSAAKDQAQRFVELFEAYFYKDVKPTRRHLAALKHLLTEL